MHYCYHTTKLNNLRNILQNGLQPIYGGNSALTADGRIGKVSYSAGLQATVDTFSVFRRFYNNVVEGRINENNFKNNLSPEAYTMHQKSISEIQESASFEDWISDNVYLCFNGGCISDRHEEKPEDSYTSESIPPEQLKVCIIRSKIDNSMLSFSMKDIYCFLHAKNPELEGGLGMWRFKKDIDKYRNDDYYMEYLGLEQFCELFPELTASNNFHNSQTHIKPQNAVKNALMSGVTVSEINQTMKIDSMQHTDEKGEIAHDE